jgi:large subunit ribosomal protein L19
MNALEAIKISPVNMEERQKIDIRSGDTVRVWQKIQEKGKTRLQAFEGLVLARKHGAEAGATFTVRRVASGVGVEKIFPLYSPMIDKIEILKRSKVRRSKLYYIREKVAREIRKQMRKMSFLNLSTGSDIEDQARAAEDIKRLEEEEVARIAEEARLAEEAAKEVEAEATKSEEVVTPAEETNDALAEKTEESPAETPAIENTEDKKEE